jgi:hypothetical protein
MAGEKCKGNAVPCQRGRNGIDRLACEIDVEQSEIECWADCVSQGFIAPPDWTDNFVTLGRQALLDAERDHHFILDDEDPKRIARISDGWRVAHRGASIASSGAVSA